MNGASLDELYLNWLYSLFANPDTASPSRTYWNLAKVLYTTEFYWLIPNDDNRVEDGRALRYEFIEDLGLSDVDPDWMDLGCSALELIIALARRLSFLTGRQPSRWFWELIENLGLRYYNDRSRVPQEQVEEVINTVIFRTYEPTGVGGLFPLREPARDQRDVELWYQMSSYLLERS